MSGMSVTGTSVAESLDEACATLAEYLVSNPDTAGHRYAHILCDLRRVRNALLQGQKQSKGRNRMVARRRSPGTCGAKCERF